MTPRSRASLLLALSLFAATVGLPGCASRGERAGTTETASLPGTAMVTARSVREAIVAGTTTREELAGTLGNTTKVVFDSGYEVWVYQYRDETPGSARDKAEFVVLVAPSGVVSKTRIRIAPNRPAGPDKK